MSLTAWYIETMKNYIKYIILFLMLQACCAWAYNLEHRPFTTTSSPERIKLIDLDRSDYINPTNNLEQPFTFTIPGDRPIQIAITRDEKVYYAELSIDAKVVVPKTAFGDVGYGGSFKLQAADLNGDGIQDYTITSWLGGCGLASGYCNIGLFLSTGDKYKLTPINVLWPEPEDFILVDGTPCIIHTTFWMEGECNDGRQHGFWIYNLLKIDGDNIQIANDLHPDFPKIIWYSFAPNHDEDKTLLTEEQKRELRKEAMDDIFWSPANDE